MSIEVHSPKWLLEKIKESKTDEHKLMCIIEFQKEIIEYNEVFLNYSYRDKNNEIQHCMVDKISAENMIGNMKTKLNEVSMFIKEFQTAY